MLWLFRRILDRLLVKSAVHVASDLEARMDLEMCETQAILLRRAHELEQENIPGLEQIAAGLRARAASLGGDDEVPAKDISAIVAVLRAEDLREEAQPSRAAIGGDVPPAKHPRPAPPAREAKKRGRPRKTPPVDLVIANWPKPDTLPGSGQSQNNS